MANDTDKCELPERFRTPEVITAAIAEQRGLVEKLTLATSHNQDAHNIAAVEHHRRQIENYRAQIERGDETAANLAPHIRREAKALAERLAVLGCYAEAAEITPDQAQRDEYLRAIR